MPIVKAQETDLTYTCLRVLDTMLFQTKDPLGFDHRLYCKVRTESEEKKQQHFTDLAKSESSVDKLQDTEKSEEIAGVPEENQIDTKEEEVSGEDLLLGRMEGKMDLLQEKFGVIEAKLDTNIAAVSDLKSEVQQLKEGKCDILDLVNGLVGEVCEMAEDMNNLRQKIKKVEMVNTAMGDRVKELKNIAETELVRTECLVNRNLDGKMEEVLEKCREAAMVRAEAVSDDEVEAVSVV